MKRKSLAELLDQYGRASARTADHSLAVLLARYTVKGEGK